uniref:Integrase catalytic domain-containing protein n=1 Tax=Heterorhabditis bacteriophora TaxID=37862 RepID=A0A1I7WRW9_HETBA
MAYQNEDFDSFASSVNQRCEEAQSKNININGIKCLLFVAGFQTAEFADFRIRLLRTLDQTDKLSLKNLVLECQMIKTYKEDTMSIEQSSYSVRAVRNLFKKNEQQAIKSKPPPYPCPDCGGNHYRNKCPVRHIDEPSQGKTSKWKKQQGKYHCKYAIDFSNSRIGYNSRQFPSLQDEHRGFGHDSKHDHFKTGTSFKDVFQPGLGRCTKPKLSYFSHITLNRFSGKTAGKRYPASRCRLVNGAQRSTDATSTPVTKDQGYRLCRCVSTDRGRRGLEGTDDNKHSSRTLSVQPFIFWHKISSGYMSTSHRLDCGFTGKSVIRYLGNIIEENGRHLNPAKIEAIQRIPSLKDVTQKCVSYARQWTKTCHLTERLNARLHSNEQKTLVFVVRKFHLYLQSRRFTLLTDYKPLLNIFGSKKRVPIYTVNRLQRWRKTSDFGQADALSCLISAKYVYSGSWLRSLYTIRVSIFRSSHLNFSSTVLGTLHKRHRGMTCMKMLERNSVYWTSIDTHIEGRARECALCQELSKNPVTNTIYPWPPGRMYLVIVEAYSKWPENIEMSSSSTAARIAQLRPLFAQFGFPDTLVSDNGTQFIAQTFQDYCTMNRIKHLRSPLFHPQSNGQAERLVDTFKRTLLKMRRKGSTAEHQEDVHWLRISWADLRGLH